jgi:E3 ubiquitin-protein ligase synoviolin
MKIMGRFTWYSLISALLAYAVVQHAFVTREQFYPTAVYLVTSKFAVVVLCNLVFVAIVLLAKLLKKMFLGELRPSEVEVRARSCWCDG